MTRRAAAECSGHLCRSGVEAGLAKVGRAPGCHPAFIEQRYLQQAAAGLLTAAAPRDWAPCPGARLACLLAQGLQARSSQLTSPPALGVHAPQRKRRGYFPCRRAHRVGAAARHSRHPEVLQRIQSGGGRLQLHVPQAQLRGVIAAKGPALAVAWGQPVGGMKGVRSPECSECNQWPLSRRPPSRRHSTPLDIPPAHSCACALDRPRCRTCHRRRVEGAGGEAHYILALQAHGCETNGAAFRIAFPYARQPMRFQGRGRGATARQQPPTQHFLRAAPPLRNQHLQCVYGDWCQCVFGRALRAPRSASSRCSKVRPRAC